MQLVDITSDVDSVVKKSGVKHGICRVFVPHTTAGVTINENADPDVAADLIDGLARIAPANEGYRHAEGNSDAHIKASLVGSDKAVMVQNGGLSLGTWQAVYFCEFDGPRTRQVWVDVQAGS